nr:isopeptide-forming domain-containing fimbrial protein [uncultured Lachnoclostridium sp.]
MNRGKKLFALLLAAVMILTMGMTGFAANGKPQAADRADVTITGITGDPTVTLYQIARANYGPGDTELVDYTWAAGVTFANEQAPTADEINAAAKGLTGGTITPLSTMSGTLTGETYTANVPAGVYIAVLTGAADGSVYNPVFLAATYGEEGNVVVDKPEQVNAGDAYLFGMTAVLKKTTPDVDKTITGGTVEDDGRDTVGIGSVVDYKVEMTMPSYPANAANKTLFLTDRLTAGLTFDYSTLTVTVEGQTVTRTGDTFILNGKVIATAAEKDNGFNLNFNYDNLVSNAAGAVYTPIVTYSAVVNDTAVVGAAGNPNDVTYYYANEPNTGNTWDEVTEEPDEAPGVTSKKDQETVYTYQLAFQKTDAETDKPLADAVFGIYSDADCTQLIDKVMTNQEGYAVSTKVAKGTYYIKELVAPTGYSLNTTVYPIEASWKTATTTVTGSVTNAQYTTQKPSEDAVQVGWIKDGRYYSMAAVTEEEAAAGGYQAAYLAAQSTTTSTVTTVTENGAGSGTALLDDEIPNTQMHALPSTGGMGTVLFTVGGIVIMAAAAVLFFLSRRKTDR